MIILGTNPFKKWIISLQMFVTMPITYEIIPSNHCKLAHTVTEHILYRSKCTDYYANISILLAMNTTNIQTVNIHRTKNMINDCICQICIV